MKASQVAERSSATQLKAASAPHPHTASEGAGKMQATSLPLNTARKKNRAHSRPIQSTPETSPGKYPMARTPGRIAARWLFIESLS